MARFLCIALITFLSAVNAAEETWFSFAEAFTAGQGQVLEISYRMHTAPMLTEILASGELVERLEIRPAEIHVTTGATFSLDHLQISAFGPDGNIRERVPLTLDLEGPADLLDLEEFITFGYAIRAARPGQATIRITSVLPSTTGNHARGAILLVIGQQGMAVLDE